MSFLLDTRRQSSFVTKLFYTFPIRDGYDIEAPLKIGEYSFCKYLKSTTHPFALGLYQNQKGKKAVAKIWQGKRKDLHYFALYHESNVYNILSKVQNRSLKRLPAKLKGISIPSYIATIKDKDRLILLREFVAGKQLKSLNDTKKQVKYYNKCVGYIRNLGESCTALERSLITSKSAKNFLTLFPFILIVALFKNPIIFLEILKGARVFLANSSKLLQHKTNTLIHGDLHPENIIVNGNKIKILDLEQTFFTYPEYEFAVTLTCNSIPKIFIRELGEKVSRKEQQEPKFLGYFLALLANCVIHYLTGNLNKEKIDLYSKILNSMSKAKSNEFFSRISA